MKEIRVLVPSAIKYLRKIPGRSNLSAYRTSRQSIRPSRGLQSNGSGSDLHGPYHSGFGNRLTTIMSRIVRDIAGICVVDRTVGDARLGDPSMPFEIKPDRGRAGEGFPVSPTIRVDGVGSDQKATHLGVDTILLSNPDLGDVPPDGKNTGSNEKTNSGTLFSKNPDAHVNTVPLHGGTSRIDVREIAWEARSLLIDVRLSHSSDRKR